MTPNRDFYRIDTALLVPRPDVATWRLSVTGMVDRPFELTYDELVALPLHEQYVTIACVSNEVGGNLVGNALWTGVRLKELLERAGVNPAATQIVGRAVDGFTVGFPTSHAIADDREPLVAVAMNGEALPANHGYPARLIVPGLYGYVSATKWLTEIELTTLEAFDAYWVPLGGRAGRPYPDAVTHRRPSPGARIPAGTVAVAGVAWRRIGHRARSRCRSTIRLAAGRGECAVFQTHLGPVRPPLQATAGEHLLRVRATTVARGSDGHADAPPPRRLARPSHHQADDHLRPATCSIGRGIVREMDLDGISPPPRHVGVTSRPRRVGQVRDPLIGRPPST